MSDLTIGEIGVVLQTQLTSLDSSQSPPVQIPLDLTNATSIQLEYLITDPTANPPVPATKVVNMSILAPPTAGVVFYSFQAGDLAKPENMAKNGILKYAIKITFNNGNVFWTANDQQLTIKDDGLL